MLAFTASANKALTPVCQQNGQDAVSEGHTGTTQIFFETPADGSSFNNVEIDFIPQNKVATFTIEISH